MKGIASHFIFASLYGEVSFGSLIIVIFSIGGLLFFPVVAGARPEYGMKVGKPCMYCHFSPTGGGALNPRGRAYSPETGSGIQAGDSLGTGNSDIPETPSGEGTTRMVISTPKTQTGEDVSTREARRLSELERTELILKREAARKTYSTVVARGRKLFHEPGLLGSGVEACADCHKSSSLASSMLSYPKWDEKLSAVITSDRKIRYCIFRKMRGKPLGSESSVTVSLATYLKEVRRGKVK